MTGSWNIQVKWWVGMSFVSTYHEHVSWRSASSLQRSRCARDVRVCKFSYGTRESVELTRGHAHVQRRHVASASSSPRATSDVTVARVGLTMWQGGTSSQLT